MSRFTIASTFFQLPGKVCYVTNKGATTTNDMEKADLYDTADEASKILATYNDIWNRNGYIHDTHMPENAPDPVEATGYMQVVEDLPPEPETPAVDLKGWVLASERLPTKEEFGPYPTVDVILQCNQENGRKPWQRRVGHAVIRWIADGRHYWQEEKDEGTRNTVLENSSWFVSHWRKIEDYPEPV